MLLAALLTLIIVVRIWYPEVCKATGQADEKQEQWIIKRKTLIMIAHMKSTKP